MPCSHFESGVLRDLWLLAGRGTHLGTILRDGELVVNRLAP